MDSITNCGKSSARKKLKGFTLVELLIVIAIISILAGMISLSVAAIVRNSRLETANNGAKAVYTGLQNALVQMEIKQQDNLLDPITYGETGTFSNYVTIEFLMDNGILSSTNLFTKSGDTANFYISDGTMKSAFKYDYPNTEEPVSPSDVEKERERQFLKLAKYVTDNLDMGFTGYVYAAIDLNDWAVDSIVFIENYSKVVNAANGINDFVPSFKTKTLVAGSANRIPFCNDIFQQRDIYDGKETAVLDAAGAVVGFYPYYNDINGTLSSYA